LHATNTRLSGIVTLTDIVPAHGRFSVSEKATRDHKPPCLSKTPTRRLSHKLPSGAKSLPSSEPHSSVSSLGASTNLGSNLSHQHISITPQPGHMTRKFKQL